MVLSIKNNDADELARELATLTGESITDAVTEALRMRLAAEKRARSGASKRLLAIAEEGKRLPRLDTRSEDEVLGFGESGITQ